MDLMALAPYQIESMVFEGRNGYPTSPGASGSSCFSRITIFCDGRAALSIGAVIAPGRNISQSYHC